LKKKPILSIYQMAQVTKKPLFFEFVVCEKFTSNQTITHHYSKKNGNL